MIDNILLGLQQVLTFNNIFIIFVGVGLGIVLGALPGVGPTMGIALLIPFTFTMDPAASMLLLVGIYCGGIYGGSITAILLKTPGTAASAATAQDGYALANKGRAGEALNLSIYATVTGGIISGVALLFVAPQVAQFGLRFGPPEFFMLAVFGLTIIAGVSGKSLAKGLVMASLGMLVATIGMDPISGTYRFTFGQGFLLSGIDLIPVLIGLFAIAEILNQISNRAPSTSSINTDVKREKFSFRNLIPFKRTLFRSSIIGTIVGAIPGTGAPIASFLSYSEAKRKSKKPEQFGEGSEEGIIAAEAANNGTTGSTLIPMMTLGIPGDMVTGVLLGALVIQGLTPGPQLFETNASLVYTVMVGFIIINIVLFFQAKFAVKFFAKIVNIPSSILLPTVLALCLIGTYAMTNTMYSVGIALVFGILGFIFTKYGYPVAPMLIAIILGPMAEQALRQSLTLSRGSYMIFFERPISLFFFILILLAIIVPVITSNRRRKLKSKNLL